MNIYFNIICAHLHFFLYMYKLVNQYCKNEKEKNKEKIKEEKKKIIWNYNNMNNILCTKRNATTK